MSADCVSPLGLLRFYLEPTQVSLICQTVLDSPPLTGGLALPSYAKYFLLTCLLEAPAYVVGGYRRLSGKAQALQIFVLNLATHPLVVFGFPRFFVSRPYGECVGASEAFAFISEILLLRFGYRYSWKRAVAVGVVANLCSWWGGAVLISGS